MVARRLVVVLLLVVGAGCSESSNASADAVDGSESTPTTTVDVAETGTTEEPVESSTPATNTAEPTEGTGSVPPVEAYDDDQPVVTSDIDDTSAWISRRSMQAESIEVVWSAPAGAAEYRVHRLVRTSDTRPNPAEMTAENLIYVGDETGVFLDETVSAGERYWYGVRGIDAEGAAVSTGWHRAAAVTDEQPPQQVELVIERRGDSVWLAWNEPEENYELHGYRILRAVGEEEAETVATTWNLDQRSFIDDELPAGVVRYSVVSFDFHWNESVPTEVVIDLS